MKTWHPCAVACLAVAVALPAAATVSKDQADRLVNGDLTPMGAEKAANKDGGIPAWTGGWTKAPPDWKGPGTRVVDPFPEDKPTFTITADNVAQYKDRLSSGQIALFARYPKT